jgi:hypothetical protein
MERNPHLMKMYRHAYEIIESIILSDSSFAGAFCLARENVRELEELHEESVMEALRQARLSR